MALAGVALRLAQGQTLLPTEAPRRLAFLLLLEVAGLAIANPINAVVIAALMMAAGPWLLRLHATGTGTAEAADAPPLADPNFPWVVGTAAAFAFLLQYVFSAGAPGSVGPFASLALGQVAVVFAAAATGGLLLTRAGDMLRGDSPTLRAFNIGLFICVANVASNFETLRGRAALTGALTEYLNVAAALVVCAFVRFDLPKVRGVEGGFNWSDLFRGTTLAQALPIISAVAAALISALAPVFNEDIGFGAMLKAMIPQTAR